MRPIKQMLAALVVLPLLLSGADDAKKGVVQQTPSQKDIVLVRVNGVNITRSQLDRHVDMMVALLKNKRKNTPPDVIAKFKRKNLKPLSDEIYQRTVLRTCLAASNVTITAQAKAAVEKECLRNFGKRKQSMDELKVYVAKAGFAKEFNANIDFDIRLRSFLTTVYSNDYYVSQSELAKVRANVAAFNKRADATNTLVKAYAAKILARAKAGEDFAKLADAYTQDPDLEKKNGGAMGDCDESDFPDEKHVWRTLSELPVGGISDLMQLEDGYAIFKVIKRNTVAESETGDASLTLARIFFRRAYKFPEQTDDELRGDVEREKRAALMSKVYKAFRAQSKVSYPNGQIKAK